MSDKKGIGKGDLKHRGNPRVGVGMTFAEFAAYANEQFDEFMIEQRAAGVGDIDDIHEAWIALQREKIDAGRARSRWYDGADLDVVWSKSARTPERHAEVLAAFRARFPSQK